MDADEPVVEITSGLCLVCWTPNQVDRRVTEEKTYWRCRACGHTAVTLTIKEPT